MADTPAPPRPTILLVDDEPHSLQAMRMALEDEFECLTAGNAEQALGVMEEEWIQVVICDQRMPGRTGVEFLAELRERWPETIRVIVTGYTDPSAMAQAINDAGIHQFLTKPWHPDQLLVAGSSRGEWPARPGRKASGSGSSRGGWPVHLHAVVSVF